MLLYPKNDVHLIYLKGITRGKKHTVRGMDLMFHNDRSLDIGMNSYLEETLYGLFPDEITEMVYTPAAITHVFNVNFNSLKHINMRNKNSFTIY
jgi:hypothetical protein